MMQFEDVEYKVRNRQGKSSVKKVGTQAQQNQNDQNQERYKKILKGITGSIGPGEILALMGPSGSGKTTLLKVIGGRLTDNVKGKVTYNDVKYSSAIKRR